VGAKVNVGQGQSVVENLLQCLATDWLRLPDALAKRWTHALYTARFSRATSMRHTLSLLTTGLPTSQGARYLDLDGVMHTTLRPGELLAVTSDLVLEGLLDAKECGVIQEALLGATARDGRWKP